MSRSIFADDLFRLTTKVDFLSFFRAFLFSRTFRPLITLRLCQKTVGSKNPFLKVLHFCARLSHRFVCGLAGLDLPWETAIAPGLAITHGWGLVVAPGTKIGRNVTLFHGVTLGRRDRIDPDGRRSVGYPTIEDEVWIGPNAIVLGDIVVGRGSRIAGGSLVLETVPAHSIVMGNPGRVVKTGCVPDVPNRVPD